MDRSGLPWRMLKPLRPVFFAGAAAAAWLTFSAPAATADTAPDQGSLLGGISSVASTATTAATDTLAGASTSVVQAAQPITAATLPVPVAPAPVPVVSVPVPVVAVPSVPLPATPVTTAPAPAAPSPTGLVQPGLGGVTDVVDDVIAAVPVVNQVVPEGTVESVTAPVVSAAETAVTEVTEAVVPDVAGALPVVDQVIEPVTDIVDVDVDAPLPLPLSPRDSAPADPLAGTSEPSASLTPAADTAGIPAVGSAFAEGLSAGQAGPLTPAATLLTAIGVGAALPSSAAAVSSGTPELPAGGEGSASGWLPAAVGSGSGGGSSSSGSSGGAAAWLTASTIDLPLTGDAPVSGPLQHAPAPVSLEPGCSPD